MSTFKPGIEGAQHGDKELLFFLRGVKKAGAQYAQLSNYQKHDPTGENWGLLPAEQVKALVNGEGLDIGASCHCPVYMATGGLQLYPGETEPFHHPAFRGLSDLRTQGPKLLVQEYLPRLFDWYAAAGIKIAAMFWGPLFDPETKHGVPTGNLDSGYGWPFINQPHLDRAVENFASLAVPILDLAQDRGVILAHEPHPKTAAWTPQVWALLKAAVLDHPSFKINADPSHAWNNQTPRQMFAHPAMASDVVIAHFKDHKITPGKPLLSPFPNWPDRGMQFCPLGQGEIDLVDFAHLLIEIGAVSRFREITGLSYFPAICEAEAAFEDGWQTALAGIAWLGKEVCWSDLAKGSFEAGMGSK